MVLTATITIATVATTDTADVHIAAAIVKISPQSKSNEPFLDAYGRRMMIVVGGALFAFLTMIHIAGFYGAIVLFMIYYMRFLGHHSWRLSLTVSVSLTVICFFFFDIAMRIVLPKGYSEPLFIPLYDIFL